MDESPAATGTKRVLWQRYLELQEVWPEWLISSLIPQQSLVLLYGARGQGKTFLALDWAASVACGCNWQGHQISNGGGVAYLLAERPEGLRRRLMGWLDVRRGDEAKLNRHMIAAQGNFHLDTPSGRKRLIKSLQNVKDFADLRLLVIDPLASFMDGSENDTRDMQTFVDGLREVSEALARCSILVVHHEGKGNRGNSKGARGSSALEAAMDTVLYMKPSKTKGGPSILSVTKQREFEASNDLHLNFVPVFSTAPDGAMRRDLGVFPEKTHAPESGAGTDSQPTKKKNKMADLDQAIVKAIGCIHPTERADIKTILAVVRGMPDTGSFETSSLPETKLRYRLTKLSTSGRLKSIDDGVLRYEVIERRADATA